MAKKKTKSSQLPSKPATTSAGEEVRVDDRLTPKEIFPDVGDPPGVNAVTVSKKPEQLSNEKKFCVSLNCPTPLRDKSLVVEAKGREEATTLFLEHNGISGSDHLLSVVEVLKCH